MKIEGIILAAGFSSRAGTFKLTLDLRGKTIIERCMEGMCGTCSRIIVVGGYRAKDLMPIIDKYPKAILVYNENYATGMYSSVLQGAKHFEGDRAFVIPGDYPVVNKRVYEKLLQVQGSVILPSYKGCNGHPVLMDKETVGRLLNTSGCTSLREFIYSQNSSIVEVSDPGVLMDVDTLEDYKRIYEYADSIMFGW